MSKPILSWELIYIYISPPKALLKIRFLFCRVGQVSFLQGVWFELGRFWMVLAKFTEEVSSAEY